MCRWRRSIRPNAWRSLSGLAALVVLTAGIAAAPRPDDLAPDESTAAYFQGLRDRRLFRLAESYCLQRLDRGGLSTAQRADLTLELARTLTEHASLVAEPEQSALRARADETLGAFLDAEPDYPRRIVLEVQRALIPAAAGESDRWLAALQGQDETIVRRASAALDEALAALRGLEERIAEQVRKGNAVRTPPGGLRPGEWRTLGQHVRQRIALALLDQAHLLPEDSPDRAAALLAAQQTLKPLADTAEDDEFTWACRTALVECTRLMGDAAKVLRDVQALEKRSPPRDAGDRLLAERLRALLSLGRYDEVAALLDAREAAAPPLPGELAFLRVQVVAAQGQAAGSVGGATTPEALLRLIEDRAGQVEPDGGGYWRFRAELILEQAREDHVYGPELAALVRRAQVEFRQGRMLRAMELYGEAAGAAERAGRAEQAFQLAFTQASIAVQEGQWGDAAADLLDLVERQPDHPRAAAAHLLAAYALGRLYDEKATQPRREEFTRVLEEHRQRFTEPETRGEATWMLGALQERRGQFAAALALYREIPWDHARGGAALAASARCFEKVLDRLRELRRDPGEWERDAIATLTRQLPSAADATLPLDRPQAEAAVRLARILLRREPPDYAAADRWLVRVLASLPAPGAVAPAAADGEPAPVDELRALAHQLRIISLAGQGEFQEARRLLGELSSGGPAELLRILEGLSPLASSDEDDPYHDLGELQLQAALRLAEQRDALSAADRRRLDECLAQAYAAAGQVRRGLELYDALLRESPRDKRLLTAAGRLLTRCGERTCLTRAQEIWRKLQALSAPGSEDWLAARYEECAGLFALRQAQEACRLLVETKLFYPELGGEPLQSKFIELDRKCGRGKP